VTESVSLHRIPDGQLLTGLCQKATLSHNRGLILKLSRNRFKEGEFLSFELPLPPLAVQKAIVERWCQSQEAIIAAKWKTERIAHEIKTEVENTLPK
jgi:hypothetical protein